MATIYANTLGTPVAKSGRYRAYKDGGLFAIYSVGPELIWLADGEAKWGKKLEACPVGFINNIENFESAVYELQIEMSYMMKAGA